MKSQILTAVATLALVGYIFASPTAVQAQTTMGQSENDGYHPAPGTAPAGSSNDMNSKGTMMQGMDMSHMKGMKEECMAKHKDGKMCDKKMMKNCQMKMSKTECKKMMDDASL